MPLNPEYFRADGFASLNPKFYHDINNLMDKVLKEKQISYHNFVDMKTSLDIILSKK